jgi:hypothetical protein
MIAYGWRYGFRDYSSETFPDWASALHDLEARFPGAARYAGYLLFLEPLPESTTPIVSASDLVTWPRVVLSTEEGLV